MTLPNLEKILGRYDGQLSAFKVKDKLILLKRLDSRHFIIRSRYFCLIYLEVLLGYQLIFIHDIQLVQPELLTFIHRHVILHSHP
jgi:hypothetical protein